MGVQTVRTEINEETTGRLRFPLLDEDAEAVALANLVTLTLTLYDADTGTIINSRNAQNVLNTNNVTVSSSGLVEWALQPEDTLLVGSSILEEHVALFRWTWTGGQQSEEIRHYVRNLGFVP